MRSIFYAYLKYDENYYFRKFSEFTLFPQIGITYYMACWFHQMMFWIIFSVNLINPNMISFLSPFIRLLSRSLRRINLQSKQFQICIKNFVEKINTKWRMHYIYGNWNGLWTWNRIINRCATLTFQQFTKVVRHFNRFCRKFSFLSDKYSPCTLKGISSRCTA